jgi:hypothetical protein
MASAPQRPMQFQNAADQDVDIDPEMEALQRRAWMRAQNEYAAEVGKAWIKLLEGELSKLPEGTHIVINCRTGKYIYAPTLREAIDGFESKFGREIAYAHQIGGGYFVGGGIV